LLAHTLIRRPRTNGLALIERSGTPHGPRELSMWRLRLDAGGTATFSLDHEEMVVVLQEGRARLRAGDGTWTASRLGVFAERATAVYVPPGLTFSAEAETPLEAVVVSAPAAAGGEAACIGPSEVEVHARGQSNYAREVHDIFVRDPFVRRLMVGETFNPPGHWSSFPPHKHDGRDGEPSLEEMYYFRIQPPQGWGQQMLYTADGESVAHIVRDGDAVVLPYGYHPVCSPPGYYLYYLWALVGAERRLALFEDPDHRWIHHGDTPQTTNVPR
jgi:5-deoxy-glucuronate isomerase